MSRHPQVLERPLDNGKLVNDLDADPSLRRRPLAWRRARLLQRLREADEQLLGWRVEDIIVGCGLTQADYSIGGGGVVHIPQVISVGCGPALRTCDEITSVSAAGQYGSCYVGRGGVVGSSL
jgi:hypothetical protein